MNKAAGTKNSWFSLREGDSNMKCNGPIRISSQLYPAFYTKFQCIADQCSNDCCHNWGIRFSKEDYLKIKRAAKTPELQAIIKLGMRRLPGGTRTEQVYGEFMTQNGPCLMQNEHGLCRLQLECGHEVLPDVCRQFPRTMTYTTMGLETGLSTACEAVVQMLWDMPEGIDFIMDPLEKQKWVEVEPNAHGEEFPVLRSAIIDILQARQFSLPRRLQIAGVAIEKVIKQWGTLNLEQWQRQVQLLCSDSALTESLEHFVGNRKAVLAYGTKILLTAVTKSKYSLYQLLLENHIIKMQYKDDDLYITCEESAYESALQKFQQHFEGREYFFENVLVNAVYNACIPYCGSRKHMWESYILLCNIYSFSKFLAVVFCDQEPSKEKLFDSVVWASRIMLHNKQRQMILSNELLTNKSATLAHMAVLVKG